MEILSLSGGLSFIPHLPPLVNCLLAESKEETHKLWHKMQKVRRLLKEIRMHKQASRCS